MATPMGDRNLQRQRSCLSVKSVVVSAVLVAGLAACGGGGPKTQRLDPVASTGDVDAVLRLADNLRDRGELTYAIAMYQQAASKTDDPAVLVKLGRALSANGAIERAAGVFRRAVSKAPEYPDALLGLGTAYLQLGEIEKSIQYLDQVVKQGKSTDLRRYLALGAAYDLAGRHDEARVTYEAGLKIEPEHLDLKSNLALSHSINDRHDQAIKVMREVIESLDAQRAHQRNMVLILALAGRDREAVALGVRQLGQSETQDVLTQASSARGRTSGAERARAIGAS
ncbi:MAG: tetratricopeptide repeat protein [Geminicoccaceae bacterium]